MSVEYKEEDMLWKKQKKEKEQSEEVILKGDSLPEDLEEKYQKNKLNEFYIK